MRPTVATVPRAQRLGQFRDFLAYEAEASFGGTGIFVALAMAFLTSLGLIPSEYLSGEQYPILERFLGFSYPYFLVVSVYSFSRVFGESIASRRLMTTLLLPVSKRSVFLGKLFLAWVSVLLIYSAVFTTKWLLESPPFGAGAFLLELGFVGTHLLFLLSMWAIIAMLLRALLPIILLQFASAFGVEYLLGSLGPPLNQLSVTFGEPLVFSPRLGIPVFGLPPELAPFLIPLVAGLILIGVGLLYFTRIVEVD